MAKINLLYIEPTSIFFYNADLPQPLVVNFPLDTMQDGEVVSREKCMQLIDTFLKTNQLLPGPIQFAISPFLTYERVLPQVENEESKLAVQAFLDMIPFENVISLYANVNGQRWVLATNKSLLDTIKRGFEQAHWTVTSAVPISILQQLVPELAQTIDFSLLLAKIDSIRQYSFLSPSQTIQPTTTTNSTNVSPKQPAKTDNKRAIMLAGVFGVLLIVLVVMLINSMAPPKPPASATLTPTPMPVVQRSAQSSPSASLAPQVSRLPTK